MHPIWGFDNKEMAGTNRMGVVMSLCKGSPEGKSFLLNCIPAGLLKSLIWMSFNMLICIAAAIATSTAYYTMHGTRDSCPSSALYVNLHAIHATCVQWHHAVTLMP